MPHHLGWVRMKGEFIIRPGSPQKASSFQLTLWNLLPGLSPSRSLWSQVWPLFTLWVLLTAWFVLFKDISLAYFWWFLLEQFWQQCLCCCIGKDEYPEQICLPLHPWFVFLKSPCIPSDSVRRVFTYSTHSSILDGRVPSWVSLSLCILCHTASFSLSCCLLCQSPSI